MKRFLIIAIIAIASCCVFTACEKESSNMKSYVGEWQAKIVYSSDNSTTHNLTLRNNGTATY
ncbi:MAG: hypothetical protein J6R16_05155, partial [Alistipes sp.]|nr:hypothetical protein [Alistipes sp.]